MKLSGKRIEQFLENPDPEVRAVLVYGPDAGLVRERVESLIASVAGDPGDPFRVADLSADEIAKDPARLADEAAAISMTGGRRAVRLRQAGDAVSEALDHFLAEVPGDSVVVLEAGDLPPRSRLRKAVEGARFGAALPCYRDDGRSLEVLIDEMLHRAGLRASPEARAYLTANLGGDRQLTRRELEKLVLYMGPDAGREVSLADAQACIGDTAALTLEDVAYAVADGDLAGVERALVRAFQEGAGWVAPLRTTARHMQRLHFVMGAMAAGDQIGDAMKRLRPPVFWKLQDRFRKQAATWSPGRLSRALTRLTGAELSGKRGEAPGETIAARTLLAIAQTAPRAQSGRGG